MLVVGFVGCVLDTITTALLFDIKPTLEHREANVFIHALWPIIGAKSFLFSFPFEVAIVLSMTTIFYGLAVDVKKFSLVISFIMLWLAGIMTTYPYLGILSWWIV